MVGIYIPDQKNIFFQILSKVENYNLDQSGNCLQIGYMPQI